MVFLESDRRRSKLYQPVKAVTLIILLLCSAIGYTQKPVELKDEGRVYVIDSSGFVPLDSIGPGQFKVSGSVNDKLYFFTPEPGKSYWYRYKLTNPDSVSRDWLLVSYNFSIDEIDLDIFSDIHPPEKDFFRDTISVYNRKLQHKQPVFVLRFSPHETKTVHMKLRNESPYQYVFAVYSGPQFFSHFFKEYLLFGLFYGLMLFVFFYSIIYFIFLNDKVILVYALFIASQILYMLFRDGNGVFLIPDATQYIDILKNICMCGLSVFVLLYTSLFLKIDPKGRLFKVFMALIVLRILYAFFTYESSTLVTFHLELMVMLFCTAQSIRFFFKGYADAKYMSVGLLMLTVSFFIYYLTLLGISSMGIGFFVLYYGMAAECIFMTIALTERFKQIKLDNFRKEQMNKELESLVASRTELLEEQSKELNLFLYSASHDLKGPLKSIKGLCNIARMDKEADHQEIYEHILSKINKLESNISDLNAVTRIKNYENNFQPVDFKALHEGVIESFKEFPGIHDVNIDFDVDPAVIYRSDSFTLRCIYQNIFENAIKYRDKNKRCYFRVSIRHAGDRIKLIFEDNGQGIYPERLPFIFNMFYRASEESKEDTGLGLYIVRLAVQKLKGEIKAESKPNEGTTITVLLPFNQ